MTIVVNPNYVLASMPAQAYVYLTMLAGEGLYEFENQDVQRVCGISDSTVRNRFFPAIKKYDSKRGPLIKQLPKTYTYQINPYFIMEGSKDRIASCKFCFLAGIPFCKDKEEENSQAALKALIDAEIDRKGATKEELIKALKGSKHIRAFPELFEPSLHVWSALKSGSYRTAPVTRRKRKTQRVAHDQNTVSQDTALEADAKPYDPKDPKTWSEEELQEREQTALLEFEEILRSQGIDVDDTSSEFEDDLGEYFEDEPESAESISETNNVAESTVAKPLSSLLTETFAETEGMSDKELDKAVRAAHRKKIGHFERRRNKESTH